MPRLALLLLPPHGAACCRQPHSLLAHCPPHCLKSPPGLSPHRRLHMQHASESAAQQTRPHSGPSPQQHNSCLPCAPCSCVLQCVRGPVQCFDAHCSAWHSHTSCYCRGWRLQGTTAVCTHLFGSSGCSYSAGASCPASPGFGQRRAACPPAATACLLGFGLLPAAACIVAVATVIRRLRLLFFCLKILLLLSLPSDTWVCVQCRSGVE